MATTLPAPLSVAPVAEAQDGVGAGDFGDGVEAVFVVAAELCVDVQFDVHGNVGFQQPIHAPKVFNGGNCDGQGVRVVTLIDEPAEAGAGIVEDRAARASIVSAVAAGRNHSNGLFGGEEVADLFAEGERFEKCREGKGAGQAGGIFLDAFEVGVFVAREKRFLDGFHLAHFAEENNFSR
jgi:hypothetical protein